MPFALAETQENETADVGELSSTRVLLVGNYRLLLKALKQGLEEEGFTVDVTDAAQGGIAWMPGVDYDVVVLDLMRPGADGLSPVRQWRRAGLNAAVLVLTAPGGVSDGHGTGVDGWLAKPFALDELLARLRSLVCRSGRNP